MTDTSSREVAHTPGPWSVYNGDIVEGPRGSASIPGTKYVASARTSAAYRSEDEVAANARLIAAAPELLNAARLAVMMLGVEARMHQENQAPKKADAVEKAISVIAAAIAKAEGRD